MSILDPYKNLMDPEQSSAEVEINAQGFGVIGWGSTPAHWLSVAGLLPD
jgi:hypothetical protein